MITRLVESLFTEDNDLRKLAKDFWYLSVVIRAGPGADLEKGKKTKGERTLGNRNFFITWYVSAKNVRGGGQDRSKNHLGFFNLQEIKCQNPLII